MARISILIVVLAALLHCSCAQFNTNCTTPDHRPGVCTSIKACPMLDWCIQRQTRSTNATEFLRRSRCGTENNGYPLVCCEIIYKPSTTSKITNPCYPDVLPRMSDKFPRNCGEETAGDMASHPTNFPWIVHLIYAWRDPDVLKIFCDGSLVSDRYVITLFSCVILPPAMISDGWKLRGIRYGNFDRDKNLECLKDDKALSGCMDSNIVISIYQSVVHNEWAENPLHDQIALLKLDIPVTFSKTVKPICLPGTKDLPQSFTRIGKDYVDISNNSRLTTTRIVTVPLVPLEKCNYLYDNKNVYAKERSICTGGVPNLIPCNRNLGAPLMAPVTDMKGVKRWTIFGIVSEGHTICNPTISADIYTKVSGNINWIIEKMDELDRDRGYPF